jgi:MFS family permease
MASTSAVSGNADSIGTSHAVAPRGHRLSHCLAVYSTDWGRRRMGRFGAHVDGMGALQPIVRSCRTWPQLGIPCGLFLANLAVLAFSQISGEQFLAWGWRVPFVLSLFLVAVGLYILLGILETPIFSRLLRENRTEFTPIIEVIRRYPRDIVLSAVLRLAEQAPFYIFTAFVFSYGMGELHVSRDFLLAAVLAASVVSFFSIPFLGYLLSGRIGRKNMYMIGAVTMGIFASVYFAMLKTGIAAIIFLAIVISLVPHDMMYGPQAALIAESFTGHLRYSGSSLGCQLASIIAGSVAPLIATWLFAAYQSAYPVAIYIAVCAVLTLTATALMANYTGMLISAEYGTIESLIAVGVNRRRAFSTHLRCNRLREDRERRSVGAGREEICLITSRTCNE